MHRRSRFEDPRFGALVAALRVVAADARTQGAALSELREVAGDVRRGAPMPQLGAEVAELDLPPGVQSLIDSIDLAFDELVSDLGDEALGERVLANDIRWERMRALAREALEELGIS